MYTIDIKIQRELNCWLHCQIIQFLAVPHQLQNCENTNFSVLNSHYFACYNTAFLTQLDMSLCIIYKWFVTGRGIDVSKNINSSSLFILLLLQNAFALTFLIFNCKQLFVSALAIKEMFWNQVVESWKCIGWEDKWKSTMGQWGAFNVKNAENTLIKVLTEIK